MAKLVGRKPIELKITSTQDDYIPIYDESIKAWTTINKADIISGSAVASGSNTFIGNQFISGSLTVSEGITGSLFGTASLALTASSADNFNVRNTLIATSVSASTSIITTNTQNGSFLNNSHQFTGSVFITGALEVNGRNYINDYTSFDNRINEISGSLISLSETSVINSSSFASRITTNSSSFALFSGSYINESSSFVSRITNNSASISFLSASFATFSGSYNTGSFTGSFTGSLLGTSTNAISASYAATASSADDFTVRGTLTAQTIVAQTITSSIEFVTGSTKNGSLLSNTHQFTGSVSITGSLGINGVDYVATSGSTSTRLTNLELFSGSYNTGSFIGGFTGSFSGSLNNLQNTVLGHIPFFTSSQVLADSVIRQLDNGSGSYSIVINQDNITTAAPEALYVWQPSDTSYNVIAGKGNLNNYLQLNIQNLNTGENASSDVVATANNGNETTNYVNMGINSEGFTGSIGDENDAYLYSTGRHLHIGTATNYPIQFFAGGIDHDANRKFQLNPNNLHELTGSLSITNRLNVIGGITASLQGTASWANNAITASHALQVSSASFASTASSVNRLNQNVVISGSLTVTGSTNIIGSSGTTLLSSNADTLVFTGSFLTSGSIISTGSLNILGGITGSLLGTASYATQALSASYWSGSIINAESSSYASNADLLDGKDSTIFATTGSNIFKGDTFISASFAKLVLNSPNLASIDFTANQFNNYIQYDKSANTLTTYGLDAVITNEASVGFRVRTGANNNTTKLLITGSTIQISGSLFTSGSSVFSGSVTSTIGFTGSLFGTSSYAIDALSSSFATSASYWSGSIINAATASYVLQAVSASYAATASFVAGISDGTASLANTASYAISASYAATASSADDFTVRGTLTAQTINVQTITSSVDFVTGSSINGSLLTNTHQFTGSVSVTGSLAINGVDYNSISASFDTRIINTSSSLSILSSSYLASSASFDTRINANSSSIAQLSGSYLTDSSSFATRIINNSASIAQLSGSYLASSASFDTRINIISSSYATTGSNVFKGNQTITGSFLISGSTTQIGNNTLTGNTTLSGSIIITGSVNAQSDINLGGLLRLDPATDPGATNLTASFLFTSASNTATGFDLYYRQNGNLVKFKWIEGMLNTGILYGGVLTYSSSYFYLSAGSGIIVNHNATTGSEIAPIIDYVTWNDSTHSIANTGSQNTYVFIDTNGDLQQQTSFFTPEQYHDLLPIGRISHYGATGSLVTGVGNNILTAYDISQQLGQFTRAFGPLKISGFTITPQVGNLSLNIGSGTAYNLGGYYQDAPDLPSTYNSNTYLTSSVIRLYRSGSGFQFDNNGGAYYTTVDPLVYDDGTGTLATVGSGNWSIQRVFVNPVTGRSHVYYGQSTYTTYLNAVQSVATDDFVESEVTKNAYVFAGYLVMKGGAANDDLSVGGTTNAIIQAGLFRNSVGGSGGATTAVSDLNDLSDVNISSPSNGQALIYSSGTWINGTPISSSYALTSSFATTAVSASYFSGSVSNAVTAISSSYALTASYVENAQTASFIQIAQTASYVLNAQTASYVETAQTASYVLSAISSSYAATASSADNFTVRGTLTAQNIVVQTITSSIEFNTGSTRNGSTTANTHEFTGSVSISGSLVVNGSNPILSNQTSSMSVATASYVLNAVSSSFATLAQTANTASFVQTSQTASYVLNAVSASRAISAAQADSATTASYVLNAVSSSFATLAQTANTASYAENAQTASFVLNALSSSFAATASSADNLTVRGTLTAQTINVQTITSSIEFNTGSTRNGSLSTNTHEFTGSVLMSGSLGIGGATFTGFNGGNLFIGKAITGNANSNGVGLTATINSDVTGAAVGYRSELSTQATSFSLGEIRHYQATQGTIGAGSTVTAQYGFWTAGLTGATNNYGFYGNIASGTGRWNLYMNGTANNYMAGALGIGTTSLTGYNLRVAKNITGATDSYGISQSGVVQSDVTNNAFGYYNALVTQATAFTLSTYTHFRAVQATIGAESSVTNQVGFSVSSTLTGATNNYGFRGQIPAGTGRWNLYMDGTANNYLAGNLGIGSGKTTPTVALDINGSALITGSLGVTQGITGSLQGTASFATSASFALTASYISGSGGGVGFPFSGSAVITGSLLVSSSFVDFTRATYVTGSFTGSLQGTASYASYAEYAGNSPGTTAAFTQSLAATTWSFTHNLNTRNPLLQVYDSTNSQVIPFNIVGDDPTTAIIYFDTPESGFAVASNGGGLTVNGSTARLNQTVAATTWSFNHDLGTRYPNFIIYGSNDEVVIPAGIKAIDNFNAEIYFSTASTGTAIANFSGISGSPNAASASYAETASFSNNFIVGNTLTIDQTLTDYHVVPSSAAGENNMFNRATGSYSSGFFKYTVANGSNARTGEVMAVWAGGAIQFTDNSTLDIGDTSGVVASAVIAASSIQFNLTTATSGWRLKSLATFM
jgi:hypothetical protein